MPKETPKQLTLRALEQFRGDDYTRARRAWGGLSDYELDQPHGNKTKREWLRYWREHYTEVERAITWVKAQPDL